MRIVFSMAIIAAVAVAGLSFSPSVAFAKSKNARTAQSSGQLKDNHIRAFSYGRGLRARSGGACKLSGRC